MSNNTPEIRFKGYTDAWEQRKLGEVCSNFKSGTNITSESINDAGGYPVYGGNGLRGYSNKFTHEGNYVLIGRQGALCGNINTVLGKSYISEHAIVVGENDLSDIKWLEQILLKMNLNQYSESSAQPGLSVYKLKEINIMAPSKSEQTAIGNFFRTLDNTITLYQRKLDGLKSLKKGYLEQMFPRAGERVPRVRFAGLEGEWEQRRLGDISIKVTDKNKNNEFDETLTNSAEYGIISQRDFFDKDISNKKNLIGYFIVKPDDFVYNPRISNFAPVGPIKRNLLGRTGVMSPLYYVFRIIDGDCTCIEKYFESVYWHDFMMLNGDNGVRSDRFNIKDSVFEEMPIPFSSIAEQTAIGSFFRSFDDQISTHQQNLNQLKQLKTAYLQKMFV